MRWMKLVLNFITTKMVNSIGSMALLLNMQTRIGVEVTIPMGSRKPRADIVVYLKDMPHIPENINIIVECKKESVSPSDKNDGIAQLKSYMNACGANCEWGLWTNKKQRIVLRKIINTENKWEFIEFNDIPDVTGNTDDIDRPKRNKLTKADGDNLFLAFSFMSSLTFPQILCIT